MVPGDVNHLVDVFWKDMVTGEVRLVSASATGVQTDFESYSPSISANGRYVVFASDASAHIQSSQNPEGRIYVKDMQTNSLQIVSSRLGDRDSSYSPSMSADGRFVVFESSMRLTTEDDPVVVDIFLKDLPNRNI